MKQLDSIPMTLSALMDELPRGAVEAVAVTAWTAPVTGIRFYDSPADLLEGAVLLCPGLGQEDLVGVIRELGEAGGSAVVVGSDAVRSSRHRRELAQEAAHANVSLLSLAAGTDGTDWVGLATACQALTPGPGRFGTATESLPDVVDAVAAMLGAPAIVTDPDFRLRAFSGQQEGAHETRHSVIVARRLPERNVAYLESRGLARRLRRDRRLVHISPLADFGNAPKLGVPLHSGNRYLGVLWLDGVAPPDPVRCRELRAAGDAVARSMAAEQRRRTGLTDPRVEHVGNLLRGVLPDSATAAGLGLFDTPVGVVVLAPDSGVTCDAAFLNRVRTGLGITLASLHSQAVTAVVDGGVYGLLPLADRARHHDGAEDPEEHLLRVVTELLGRTDPDGVLLAGTGRVARSAEEVPLARRDGDRVIDVLRSRTAPAARRRAATAAETKAEALLLDAARAAVAHHGGLDGPVSRLAGIDAERGTQFVRTLRHYLNSFGNVAEAAALLHVHPNTLRHRLGRIQALTGLDVGDPEARFAAAVELRLLSLHTA
ncbi:transcriptional regulator [Streptomyces spiralis]|uniref:Transcriptional regulator n=1 Tax=Streptomyces spiralis TaxID=66376 RepID=A0A919AHP6_9ACTN|nr:helix-turn-helix domain-containing protein [Streptomyces spiralis]GHF09488.1 transcriptional regulator [Streptomyces spiralis]